MEDAKQKNKKITNFSIFKRWFSLVFSLLTSVYKILTIPLLSRVMTKLLMCVPTSSIDRMKTGTSNYSTFLEILNFSKIVSHTGLTMNWTFKVWLRGQSDMEGRVNQDTSLLSSQTNTQASVKVIHESTSFYSLFLSQSLTKISVARTRDKVLGLYYSSWFLRFFIFFV